MKTYIKTDGERITGIVTSSVAPTGYICVAVETLPHDLFADLNSYTFDGTSFSKRTVSEDEERSKAFMQLRMKRDRMLSACDWTQVPDAPVDQQSWAVYRQSLRDLPANTTDPCNPVWPTPPA